VCPDAELCITKPFRRPVIRGRIPFRRERSGGNGDEVRLRRANYSGILDHADGQEISAELIYYFHIFKHHAADGL